MTVVGNPRIFLWSPVGFLIVTLRAVGTSSQHMFGAHGSSYNNCRKTVPFLAKALSWN